VKLISTSEKAWQRHCWELAKAGKEFEILNLTPRNLLFLEELCAAYQGKHKRVGGRLQLTFPSSKTKTINDDLEPELRILLKNIADSKMDFQENRDLCISLISESLQKETLGAKSIEVLQKMLDILEIFGGRQEFSYSRLPQIK